MRYRLVPVLLLIGCHPAPAPRPAAAAAPAAAPAPAPLDDASAQAACDAKDWGRCGEQFGQLAAREAKHAAGDDYNAACCYARGGQADRAFATLEQAIAAGYYDRAHAEVDEDLVGLHADPRWASTLTDMDRAEAAWEKSLSDPALRKELLAMRDQDQAARNALIAGKMARDLGDKAIAIDRKDTARMKEIVAKVGWPGLKLVGKDGAQAAWLLVQHADLDREFQKQCLALLERAVAASDADPTQYAYLYDRVAVAEKRPQRYGTQFANGEPAPMEDPAHVDDRRKSVGLGTMAEYRQQMRAAYGPSIK